MRESTAFTFSNSTTNFDVISRARIRCTVHQRLLVPLNRFFLCFCYKIFAETFNHASPVLKLAQAGFARRKHASQKLKHHETQNRREINLTHHRRDEVSKQVQVRIRHLAQHGPRLTHPVDVWKPRQEHADEEQQEVKLDKARDRLRDETNHLSVHHGNRSEGKQRRRRSLGGGLRAGITRIDQRSAERALSAVLGAESRPRARSLRLRLHDGRRRRHRRTRVRRNVHASHDTASSRRRCVVREKPNKNRCRQSQLKPSTFVVQFVVRRRRRVASLPDVPACALTATPPTVRTFVVIAYIFVRSFVRSFVRACVCVPTRVRANRGSHFSTEPPRVLRVMTRQVDPDKEID